MENFSITHVVPEDGLPTWPKPDINSPAGPALDPGLPVHLAETWGAWARVVCSNGWEAWVQARRLVPAAPPAPAVSFAPISAPPPQVEQAAPISPVAPVADAAIVDTQPIQVAPAPDVATTQPVMTTGIAAGAAGTAAVAAAPAGYALHSAPMPPAGYPPMQTAGYAPMPQAGYAPMPQAGYSAPPPPPPVYGQQPMYGAPYMQPQPQPAYPGYAPPPPGRAMRAPATGLARIQWVPLLSVVAVVVAPFLSWFGQHSIYVNAFHVPASLIYRDQALGQVTPFGPALGNAFGYVVIAAGVVILAGILIPRCAWLARIGGVAALAAGIDFAVQVQRALNNFPGGHSSVFSYLGPGPYVAAAGGLFVLITMRRTRWARP